MSDLIEQPPPKNLTPAQFMALQITDQTPVLEYEKPEDLDEGDLDVIAAGIILGHSRYRIVDDLKVLWYSEGADFKFQSENHALQYVAEAIKLFKPQVKHLKRLYRDADADNEHFAQRNARLAGIGKYIRVLDASMTRKIAGGVDVAELDAELTHYERLMKLARGEMGKTTLNRHLHEVTPPGADPTAPDRPDPNLIEDISAEELEKRMIEQNRDRMARNDG